MFDEYFQYTEKLLNAQYGVSEMIRHMPTRGKVREDFLRDIIEKNFNNKVQIDRGTVEIIEDENEAQIDLFLTYNNALVANWGKEITVRAEDCRMIIEVKSNATGTDIQDFNKRVRLIKENCIDKTPLCGMFCYKIDLQKKTLLERCGYQYEEEAMSFLQDNGLVIEYPYLDFIVNIDQEENEEEYGTNQVFLRKDTADSGFVLIQQYPVIKEFLGMIQSLLR